MMPSLCAAGSDDGQRLRAKLAPSCISGAQPWADEFKFVRRSAPYYQLVRA
jgi:hypothetical protein